jgi:hypothetical protein
VVAGAWLVWWRAGVDCVGKSLRARGTGAAVNRHRAALSKGVTVATISWRAFWLLGSRRLLQRSRGGVVCNKTTGNGRKAPHQCTASNLATTTQESKDQGVLERDPELSMLLVRNALPVVRCLVDEGCQSSQLLGFSCTISSTGGFF